MITGEAHWKRSIATLETSLENDDAKAPFDFNVDMFVNIVAPAATPVMLLFLAVSFILDIICWRRRGFASVLFYFECLQLVVSAFIAQDMGDFEAYIVCMQLIILVALLACEPGLSIIIATFIFLFMQFLQAPGVRGHKDAAVNSYQKITGVLVIFIASIII